MGNCCDSAPDYDESDGGKQRNPRTLRKNICCTDIVVLIIFFAFWAFLAFIAITSLIRGDARRVIYGYDTSGNTCNQKNNKPIANLSQSGMDTTGKENVFFMSTLYPKNAVQICVEKCPDKKMTKKKDVVDFYKRTQVNLCEYGVIPDENLNFAKEGPCPELPIYKSISIMSRCVPDPISIANETEKLNITNRFSEIFQVEDFINRSLHDLSLCWRELIGLAIIGVVVAFLMVVMMRFLASVIVWLIVVLAIVGSVVGTVFLWWCFAMEVRHGSTDEFLVPLIGSSIKKRNAFLVFSIIATILTVILLLVLFIMRKRISLVVALFHEAGKCLADVPLLLIQPLWTFLIWTSVTLYFVFIMACISTMGTPISRTKNKILKVKFEKTMFEKQFWWIHLIGWIWTSEFILACQEFVITSSVVIWYFSSNKKSLGFPILRSISLLILHHMGSIAFGSLIITIVKVIRYILMYIESKCKGSENACARCCLKCCICCLWCLEKVLKFLHQNAYTVIAIQGTNFCTSAKKAFEIITSNALRVAAINSVGDFVLFLGKVGVMCLNGGFAVLWLRTIPEMKYIAVPVILVCIFSFLIAHCFLSVYEMVVDALLICFCEDCERNDGTPGREYFMSQSLMKFVTDSSAHIEKGSLARKGGRDEEDAGEATGLKPTIQ